MRPKATDVENQRTILKNNLKIIWNLCYVILTLC